jgi:uracil-DNA glycosylase family 4
MGREMVQDWRASVASVLDWWGDAGVDTLLDDAPRDWLARPAPVPSGTAQEPIAAPAEVLPDTLEAFITWRMGDTSPEFEWFTPRVAPSGMPGASLMVLTDVPEADDSESLLTGPAGRLFDKMLAALGESRETIYLASLAIARPLTGRIPPEQEERLVQLARHHIALAAPQKLLLLGQATERVLTATSGSASSNDEAGINDFGRIKDAGKGVAVRHPRFMLEQAKEKAAAWKQLVEFNRGDRP